MRFHQLLNEHAAEVNVDELEPYEADTEMRRFDRCLNHLAGVEVRQCRTEDGIEVCGEPFTLMEPGDTLSVRPLASGSEPTPWAPDRTSVLLPSGETGELLGVSTSDEGASCAASCACTSRRRTGRGAG